MPDGDYDVYFEWFLMGSIFIVCKGGPNGDQIDVVQKLRRLKALGQEYQKTTGVYVSICESCKF